MKVKLLRSCWLKDEKRGCMFDVKKGQEIDLDISVQGTAEMVYGLLQNAQATVTDPEYVPLEARYFVRHAETFLRADGSLAVLFPGKELELPQEIANKFLTSGHVRPVDRDQWIPMDLIRPRSPVGEVKRMFDIEPPPKNFATDGGFKRER